MEYSIDRIIAQQVDIRGINIIPAQDVYQFADFLLNQGRIRAGKLVAINAEKVILAEQNQALWQLLQNSEYKYADGMSIVHSIKRKYPQYQTINRIAGIDLWLVLMKKSVQYQLPVFVVGSSEDVINQTAEKLRKMNVNVVGQHNGYFSPNEQQLVIQSIQQSRAKLVSIAMGSPKQEQFMQKIQQQCPDILLMGVGGTYDVFVGKVKRAPLCWQKMGLEWLYRLALQPTRWRRQQRLVKYAYYYLTNQL